MKPQDQNRDPDKWTISSSAWWTFGPLGIIAIIALLAQFLLRLIGH